VNDAQQREFAQVFGEAELANLMAAKRDKSGRLAEGIARRLGGTLPDMRAGVPKDPGRRPVAMNGTVPLEAEPDAGRSTKAKRTRSLKRTVPLDRVKPNRQKDGTSKREPVAWRKDELEREEARIIDETAIRPAVTEAEQRALDALVSRTNALNAIPLSSAAPARLRETQAAVRLYATKSLLGRRAAPNTPGAGVFEEALPFKVDHELLANDREIRHLEAHGWGEAESTGPPRNRTAERSCVHCRLDPIETKKDDLCQLCKRYKKSHAGQLPPPSVIANRKRKRSQ
jgi:hypothetical protein